MTVILSTYRLCCITSILKDLPNLFFRVEGFWWMLKGKAVKKAFWTPEGGPVLSLLKCYEACNMEMKSWCCPRPFS